MNHQRTTSNPPLFKRPTTTHYPDILNPHSTSSPTFLHHPMTHHPSAHPSMTHPPPKHPVLQVTCTASKFAFTRARRFCSPLPRRLMRSPQVATASSPASKIHCVSRHFRSRPSKPGLVRTGFNQGYLVTGHLEVFQGMGLHPRGPTSDLVTGQGCFA